MPTNPLAELPKLGQSVWYDQMQRSLVTEHKLAQLIERDDLRGLTSNPTIFEKAIGGTAEYDPSLEALAAEGKSSDEIFEALVVEDIGLAADVFKPVYEKTKGLDGYVSLEVSPRLAHDTAETVAEGLKLFKLLGRDNVMIKVPATPPGIPAIEELIYNGVNVNVTLIFSTEVYEQVIDAYIRGLERRIDEGKSVGYIASVASFFVSRIDSKVDAALEKKIAASTDEAEKARLGALLGKIAIANAKMAYQLFKARFSDARAMKVRNAGAVVQRPLWASTGTKNAKYSDVLYIEQLIGADTVNTVPPATYEAFRDHGKVAPTLDAGADEAKRQLAELEGAGISLKQITDELTAEGVKSFAASFDSLVDTIEARRDVVERQKSHRENFQLGKAQAAADKAAADLEKNKAIARIWKKDATLWKSDEAHKKLIDNSLGWVGIPEVMQERTAEIKQFAAEVKSEFDHVVLLGMGGSSLCAEVLRRVFGKQQGWPELHVLDSTVPAAVISLEKKLDLPRTLFIVASKSGTTTEPATFQSYFFDRVGRNGRQFIAITDPGTELERIATADGYRKTFVNFADIGGRYSALSYFGLVPAALAGIDIDKFISRAVHAMHACSESIAVNENPGALLGAAIASLAMSGRDKLTIVAPRSLETLGLWIEQLIAESTGKEGKGVLPIAAEPLLAVESYGNDRLFVRVGMGESERHEEAARVKELAAAGHPVIELNLRDEYDLADTFYIWEFATAVAGSLLGINPFDQPNVQESKDNTRELLEGFKKEGSLPQRSTVHIDDPSAVEAITELLSKVKPGDYVALTEYIEESAGHDEILRKIREQLAGSLRVATTSGYGPRFLHSTGQLHKGGSDQGVFIQITADDVEDVPVPGEKYTFGVLEQAQATGDFQSLEKRNRRALHIHLGRDTYEGLRKVAAAVEQATTVQR